TRISVSFFYSYRDGIRRARPSLWCSRLAIQRKQTLSGLYGQVGSSFPSFLFWFGIFSRPTCKIRQVHCYRRYDLCGYQFYDRPSNGLDDGNAFWRNNGSLWYHDKFFNSYSRESAHRSTTDG